MRVMHILHSHGYGGAENHVLIQLKAQKALGHDVMFIGPRDSWLGDACAAEGIEQEHLAMRGLFDPVSHWKLRRLVRQWRPDIVHGHQIRGSMYAGVAGHKHKAPLAISSAHAPTAKTHMWRCAHILAVSEAVKATLVQVGYAPTGISVIHNGVPDGPHKGLDPVRQALRAELQIPEHVTAVVSAGRFVHDKGQDQLLQVLAHTPQDVHLYLIGDPNTEFGKQALQTPHDRKRTHLLGYRNDVQRILPAFDIYALSSRSEGLPLCVAEAFVAGLPVVATAVGGVPEIVIDEHTGLLIPKEDPQRMAAAISRLHHSREFADTLGKNGRQHFQQYLTVQHMVEQTVNCYANCLNQLPAR